MEDFPSLRLAPCNDAPVRAERDFVLYWMIANRRTRCNFSLQRAVDWAQHLKKPLVVFEALRIDYPWASRRFHRFVLQGMRDNAAALRQSPILYYPYVESTKNEDHGLFAALAAKACVIVTDDFPCFFLPRMVRAVARRVDVLLEQVDSNGILPMRAADRTFTVAHSFRRFLHHHVRDHLVDFPREDPLQDALIPRGSKKLIAAIQASYPPASSKLLSVASEALDALPLDQTVGDAVMDGGSVAAQQTLDGFLRGRLVRYGEERNSPEADAASGLSPYLHFGHISAHDVFVQLSVRESWNVSQLADKATGSREGWWNMSTDAESFLDELITWREVGYNMCSRETNYDRYQSLPDWAQATLGEHRKDPRPYVYDLAQLENSRTHDELWNAAQTQLFREGRMHNYLRMLWGKKILEWSTTPEEALAAMIHLNNKYAVDGRNPNSYSGIFWCLGRYDRAWGPERKIFGKIRYMSSDNTARKIPVKRYIENYAPNRLFR
ncbi:deoxyribodipyrimidine photolyase [Blastopirellula sp. J2-11]|uniref:deoxyribodipyrimidine photolyase n=1 Tax=Blastopirellula sp. J2-11 TaxID=2943192 RepID=UPI0021C78F9F|nr:deoxyribodipyrimidine photolyase [Blastopirellula sp. J2-11]UUO09056.1 deoxyribodipyrimidine photolyase [Blastopirellula sp. J2-11]